MSCRVRGCTGDMTGQMLSCAPHWSLLPQDLRLRLVAGWDAGQQRQAWPGLVAEADAAWADVQDRLAGQLLALPPDQRAEGRVWRRLTRHNEQEGLQ